MKKGLSLIILSTFLLASCNLFNKENKAIEICQSGKFQIQTDNFLGSLAAKMYGLSADATWLDFANIISQQNSC